jgi:hypothetical protein
MAMAKVKVKNRMNQPLEAYLPGGRRIVILARQTAELDEKDLRTATIEGYLRTDRIRALSPAKAAASRAARESAGEASEGTSEPPSQPRGSADAGSRKHKTRSHGTGAPARKDRSDQGRT